jgi:diguanylate cyclase (GGDEF)-like protein
MRIHGPAERICVLTVQSREPCAFAAQETAFIRAVANVLADAIERARAEEEIRHQALHDPLTGLPNRALFVDRLDLALAHGARRGSTVAVLFIDLDHFKLVNDSLGHSTGDELLRMIGARLDESIRPGDTVARFGGDEFVVICDDLDCVEDAVDVAQRLARALERPFGLGGAEHHVRASIGVATSGGVDRAADDLIREADAAMYGAKEGGRDRCEVFDEDMRTRALKRLRTENELVRALETDELVVHYQPVVSLAAGQVVGVEALVRWLHPERGMIPPDQFIPVAEDSGSIVRLGEHVLRLACRQAALWRQERSAPLWLSVNLSVRQFAQANLADVLDDILAETGLDGHALKLEITESALMKDPDSAARTLQRVKERGPSIVLDDFGTGYSSLAYVQRFPIDVIKIDRSFIRDLAAGTDATIVSAIVSMARGIGVPVVAEGVETAEQAAVLRALGCDFAQGYHYAKPLAVDEVAPLLAGSLPVRVVA